MSKRRYPKLEKTLVTGSAGFIGFHVARRLLEAGHSVIGLDNLNPFYDEGLKSARLELLRRNPGFEFVRADIADRPCIQRLFAEQSIGPIIHLAAQAGVRYSLENPYVYAQSNLVGFINLIEEAQRTKKPSFIFASSSSVYGNNPKIPFSEQDNVDHPISLYAATKKSNELIAHVYAHLYNLPVIGLRFFTVYGPWGRPDMAMFKFCKAILEGTPIEMFNYGNMKRDFTYIDDVVEGVIRVMKTLPVSDLQHSGSRVPYSVYNIGNNQPVELSALIKIIEEKIGKKAITNLVSMRPGDVPATYADIDGLFQAVGYRPKTRIEEGVSRFVDWYRAYYKL